MTLVLLIVQVHTKEQEPKCSIFLTVLKGSQTLYCRSSLRLDSYFFFLSMNVGDGWLLPLEPSFFTLRLDLKNTNMIGKYTLSNSNRPTHPQPSSLIILMNCEYRINDTVLRSRIRRPLLGNAYTVYIQCIRRDPVTMVRNAKGHTRRYRPNQCNH